MQTISDKFSFIGAALSLIVTYVTAAVPIPLYGLYQTQDQIGYLALSVSSVVYFVDAVTALLLFGRLTNYLCASPSPWPPCCWLSCPCCSLSIFTMLPG